MTPRRVAITGIGIVSSLGNSFPTIATSLREGRSGLIAMPEWRELGLRSWVAGNVDTAQAIADSGIARRALETMGEVSALCAIAAESAIADAAIDRERMRRADFGCIVGSGVGSMPAIYEGGRLTHQGQARRVRPHSVLQSMSSAPSAHLVQTFGVGGRSYSISAACATSANTIGHAFELIRDGRLESALSGGGEEINLLLASAFSALRIALSSAWNEQPTLASRPFDAGRDGFVLSGGAGILVLEELGAAKRRGARIYGEILGYASNSDPFDLILPEPEGRAAADCMALAIANAGLQPGDIDYVNAHATGTPAGDIAEVRALRKVFGSQLPPFSSTKALGGHTLGAAGAHEAIHSLAMLDGGFLAASANLDQVDPALGDAPVLREPLERSTRVHLSNSFGFGGTNATLVIGGPERANA